MPHVVEEGHGFRRWSDGRLEVTPAVAGAMSILAGEVEDEDEVAGDDDDDSVEGEESDDDNELGAEKKKKKKRGLLSVLLGNKKKEPKATSNKTTTLYVQGSVPPQMDPKNFEAAFVNGSATRDSAGTATITMRPQHDFWADHILFNGSLEGSSVTSIKFGAETLWSGEGIDVSIFQANNPMKDTLKGTRIAAGLDIEVQMVLPGAGTGKVFIQGRKQRKSKNC